MGVTNILCFVIGTRVGQKVSKGEEIKLPTVNPMEAYKEQRSKNQAERENNRMNTIMQNIENYNGSAMGQKDVPEG